MRTKVAALVVTLLVSASTVGRRESELELCRDHSRHPSVKISDTDLARLRAEGECLAGVKALGSLPMDQFQPNIEWLNIRTQAMLASNT